MVPDCKWLIYTKWPFDAAEAKRRQEETAQALGVDVEQEIDVGKGAKMAFILIPAGEFLMGSPPTTTPEQLAKMYGGSAEWYREEYPQHRVRLSRPFWLGKFPVTQEQWAAVKGGKPNWFEGRPQNPVESERWEQCQDFARALAARPGHVFRLPTEAEWEYACRAGTATQFCFGDDRGRLRDYAWFGESYPSGSTQPVGQKHANAWGLHDMHGNVWEWCEDRYGAYEEGAQTDPTGPETGEARVVRGGSWNVNPRYCRSAFRYWDPPGGRDYYLGFRLILAPGP